MLLTTSGSNVNIYNCALWMYLINLVHITLGGKYCIAIMIIDIAKLFADYLAELFPHLYAVALMYQPWALEFRSVHQ